MGTYNLLIYMYLCIHVIVLYADVENIFHILHGT